MRARMLVVARVLIERLRLRMLLRTMSQNPVLSRMMSFTASVLFSGVENYRLVLASGNLIPEDGAFAELVASSDCSIEATPGKVALVISTLAPGGAERQLVNTAQLLREKTRFDPIVICQRAPDDHPEKLGFFKPELSKRSIRLIELWQEYPNGRGIDLGSYPPICRRSFSDVFLYDVAMHYRKFLVERPEVVHVFLDWTNVTAGLAAVMAGVPKIVLSCRNFNPTHLNYEDALLKPAYNYLRERSEVVILNNSQAGAEDYCRWLDWAPGSITVMRNCILQDKEKIAGAGREQASTASDPRVLIGGMMRLSAEKRPLLWVDTLCEILRVKSNARGILIGDGPLRTDVVRRIERSGFADRITLQSSTSDQHQFFDRLDLFLLTSAMEGTPNVVLEAQSCGVAVIATDVGGTAEAVEDGVTGRVLRTDDPAVLAQQAVDMISNDDLMRSAKMRGAEFVQARFGTEQFYQAIQNLYE